ncbi:MAG: ABC transporter substrate-binding protein, partial [Actinomycetota bacterium]|nr:ABC transporter substrate-binding protein [Actinomycetota bacterium]
MKARSALVVLAIVVVTACGGGDSARQDPAPSAAPALPFEQQTLTVATPGDVYITRDRNTLGMWPDNANICETLVTAGQDLEPVGVLATRWTLIPPNTFRFELRRGVTFHNGTPFTAEAVRYSFNRVVEKNLALTTFVGQESTRVVDDYTVDITPTQPNLRLPEQIAHPNFSIVAPGTIPNDRPVCTGPFEFVSYTPNDQLTARRSETYWGEKPKLRQLTFRFIPDQNTRRLALESGDVDGVYFLPPQQAASVRARPNLTLAPTPPGATVVLSFNMHGAEPHTLMQDIDLRRALAWSLDPKGLADVQWQGTAQPLNTVMPPSVLGTFASEIQPITNDLRRANEVLDQKGWRLGSDGIRERDGRKLSLVAPAQFDFEPESLQFLQAQARRAGIDLRIEKAPDGAAYAQRINSGNWDVDVNYWNQNDANPASILSRLYYGKNTAARIRFTNVGEKFDALVDEALAAPDTTTAARKSVDA